MKYLFEIIALKLRERNKFLLSAIFLIIIGYVFFCVREYYQMKAMGFRGVVQNIEYDIKGDATVTINGYVYKPISNDWSFRGQIQRGDSLVKFKNTMIIKLIKQKTGKEILFY